MDLSLLSSYSVELLILFGGLTFLAAFVQGAVGFGFAIVAVPVLSLIDPRLAPVPQLLATGPLVLALFLRERKHTAWRGAIFTTLGRLPGTAIGVSLLLVANQMVFDFIIGGIVLIAVVLLARGASLPRNKGTEFLAGLFSGVGGTVSSIGGPPIALLYRNEKGPTVRGTLSAIFLVGYVITVAGRALAGKISGSDVLLAAVSLPMVFLGLRISRAIAERIEGRPLQWGILAVSTLSSVGLLTRAVWEATH